MKTTLLISFLFCFNFLLAQNIQFPPAIVSAGGSSVETTNSHLSKWRIGSINVIQLNSNLKSKTIPSINEDGNVVNEDWSIICYPNPTSDYLNIHFSFESKKVLGVRLSDITGHKLIERKPQLISPEEIIELDLTKYAPAFYLVHIWSEDNTLNHVLKISKK